MMDPINIPSANDSTQAGVLSPSQSDLIDPNDVLRVYLSALTGLDEKLVRLRWLPKPGTQPKVGIDWAAVGVESITTDGMPFRSGDKPQTDEDPDVITVTSWQTLRCIASFYGPHAAGLADRFREGILLPQNDAELRKFGLTIQSVNNEILHLPDLLFQTWIDRYDVIFRLGRSVTRTYGVRTIKSADFELLTEKGKL